MTEIPPEGEGALKKTVPVALVPPATLVGLIAMDCSKGAFGSGATLTKIDFVASPALAKTFPPVEGPETELVPGRKAFVLIPAAIGDVRRHVND